MAFHLQNIPFLETVLIGIPSEALGAVSGTMQIGLLKVLQFVVIMIAAVFAAVAMWRIRAGIVESGAALWRWRIVDALAAVYLIGALALLFVGDSHA